MPDRPAAGLLGREAVPEQGRNEHDGPLHPLRLVDRHDPDCIGVRVLVVLPTFRIRVLGTELEEVGE